MAAKRSKYGNTWVTHPDTGQKFQSKKEFARYEELAALERAGEINNLECQYRFPCNINGRRVCTYICDFTYVVPNHDNPDGIGDRVFEDVKGFRTSVYKLKKKLVEALFGVEIVET